MKPPRPPLLLVACLLCLSLVGCSKRRRSGPPDPAPMHPRLTPIDYGWIREGFSGHPFLVLRSLEARDHSLPGKALAEVRLARLEPEAMVRAEIERLNRLVVAPDTRMRSLTYVVRGLGDSEWGVLLGTWSRGQGMTWSHPDGP